MELMDEKAGGLGGASPAWEWAEQTTRLSLAPRTATHWWEASGVEARSLLKLYGIRFDILVTGRVGGAGWGGQGRGGRGQQPWPERLSPGVSQAGKFGIIPTTITLGTGVASLGVVSPANMGSLWLREHMPDLPECTLSPLCLLLNLRVTAGGMGWEGRLEPGHGSALPLPDHLLL